MIAASVGAIVARPSARLSDAGPAVVLEQLVPRAFGDWREDPLQPAQVVNPQTRELLDKLYSQVLARVYVNRSGYRIMLSLAYGSDQRGGLQAHRPEVCYPAQGFEVRSNEAALIRTGFGEIAGRRLFTALKAREEPLTYWFTIGERPVQGKLQRRLAQLSFGLSGRIPDGMLFRVSSIDRDRERAYAMQEQFINDLLGAVPALDRRRLSGLGEG